MTCGSQSQRRELARFRDSRGVQAGSGGARACSNSLKIVGTVEMNEEKSRKARLDARYGKVPTSTRALKRGNGSWQEESAADEEKLFTLNGGNPVMQVCAMPLGSEAHGIDISVVTARWQG